MLKPGMYASNIVQLQSIARTCFCAWPQWRDSEFSASDPDILPLYFNSLVIPRLYFDFFFDLTKMLNVPY